MTDEAKYNAEVKQTPEMESLVIECPSLEKAVEDESRK